MNAWSRNFWSKADYFCPALVRLSAKEEGRHGRALTNADIATRSGLTEFEVLTISQALSWEGIDMVKMRRFLNACNADFENQEQWHRLTMYKKGRTVNGFRLPRNYAYLRKSPDWKGFFEPLMERIIDHARKLSQAPRLLP